MSTPREMIEDIRNVEGVAGGITLNEWEEEFVESIENVLNNGWSLSPGRLSKLREIWDRI